MLGSLTPSLHLAEGRRRCHLGADSEVRYKTLLCALRWPRHHPGVAPPPMTLQEICLDLPQDVLAEITRLPIPKAGTREIGSGPRLPRMDALIGEKFEPARDWQAVRPRTPGLRSEAGALFLAIVKEHV